MKTKFTVLLTALLMLWGLSAHAQDSQDDVKDDSTEQTQSAVEGDVNGDGEVNKEDIEEVIKIITGDSDNANGDVTGDGKVNVADIVAIVNIMMPPAEPPTGSLPGSQPEPQPQTEPQAEPQTDSQDSQESQESQTGSQTEPEIKPVVAGNPVININVKITNNTGSPQYLDGRLRFVLGNPDHNGTYYGGFRGDYFRTDNIYFSPTSIVLGAGETRSFTNLSWRDADTGCGLGETSPLNPGRLPILDDNGGIAYARNVLIYIGGRSDLVLCDNLSSNIVFKDGETYDIVISGGSAPTPQPVSGTNPVISFGVRITNAHGSDLTLDGRLRFVLGNPDHNGTYYGGFRGDYFRTDNIWFCSGSVYLAPGETRTFYGLSWRDADTGCGLGETSPLNPGRLPIRSDDGGIAFARNVLIYIGGRSDLILCDNLSGSLIFQQDGMYDIVIR